MVAETATAIAEAMQIIFIMMVVIGCVERGLVRVCTLPTKESRATVERAKIDLGAIN